MRGVTGMMCEVTDTWGDWGLCGVTGSCVRRQGATTWRQGDARGCRRAAEGSPQAWRRGRAGPCPAARPLGAGAAVTSGPGRAGPGHR